MEFLTFLENNAEKIEEQKNCFFLEKSKPNSIEKIISKALTDTEINCKKSHYLIMKQETIAD